MARTSRRGMRRVGGTPIEEAPVWALAILTAIFWGIVFLALVGLLNGLRLIAGGGWTVAAAAGLISLLVVVGAARQKPWERPGPRAPFAQPPAFVRFSTWLFTAVMVPNVLFGALVLSVGGEGLDYLSAWLIGAIVSAIHGGFALADRWRRRVAGRRGPPLTPLDEA